MRRYLLSLLDGCALANPKFIPEVGGVVGGLAKEELSNVAKGQVPGAKSVTKGLGGLLGKKNK